MQYKNFSLGKTTNERFAKKTANRNAELVQEEDDQADLNELESLNRSLVADNEVAKKKKSTKADKKRNCCQNWKYMMYGLKIESQRDLYDKQIKRLSREQKTLKEVARGLTFQK